MSSDAVMARELSGVERRKIVSTEPGHQKQLSQPFYLRIDEEREIREAVEDNDLFQGEGREGAWWLISVIGSILLLMLTHRVLADLRLPTLRTVRITQPRLPIVPVD